MVYARYRDMKIISSLPFIQDPTTPAEESQALLDELQATWNLYTWIGIAGQDGLVKSATDGVLTICNGVRGSCSVAARPWWIACQTAPFYLGDVHGALLLQSALNLTEPLRLLDVAVPLLLPNGTRSGVLGSHLNATVTRAIEKTVLEEYVSESPAELFMVGSTGLVQAPVGSLENDTTCKNDTSSSMFLAQTTRSGSVEERWPNGIRYVTGFAKCYGTDGISLNWTILVRTPVSEAYAAANHMLFVMGMADLGIGIIVIIGSYVIAHIATAPLVSIALAADAIRKRSIMPRIPVIRGLDEIAVLSSSLNSLVSSLIEKEINLKGMNQNLMDKVELLQKLEAGLRASEETFRQLSQNLEEVFWM
ncbi:hypothetical protein HK104_000930 [Borealophlyctis nickersoniae]|nr:hypothetical protein HK104_000930 [Borealophlyctis nickersoniae]